MCPEPRATIRGSSARVMTTRPVQLVSIICTHWSRSASCAGSSPRASPALLTRMSTSAQSAGSEAVTRSTLSLPADWAEVDILVNNAGLALGLEPAQEADLDQWVQMIETNCTGLVVMTRALLPRMVARGSGHIVNLGSIAGTYPYPGGNVYGATKAFVHQFSLNLRSDLHGSGIRVTCIEPGLSDGTEFSEVRFGGDAERAAAVYTGTHPLTADDIAAAIEWATSQPPNVNVNTIELMATSQSFAPFQIYRS